MSAASWSWHTEMVDWSKTKHRLGRLFQTKLKSRREKWDDFVVLAIFFYLIPACAFVVTYNELQLQPWSVSYPKPNNHDRSMSVVLNFYSVTFGAGDRVHVYMTIVPDDVSKQEYLDVGGHFAPPGIGLPQYYYLVFEGSLCDSRVDIFRDMFKETQACQIRVPYIASEGVYKNNAYFTYPVSGLYHVLLSDQPLESNSRTEIRPGFVQIEPIESYISYKTNKTLMFLAVLGTFAGAIAIYAELRQSI